MTRRILTGEDVAALAPGERLVLGDDVTLTPAGRDMARRRGIELVEVDGPVSEAQAADPALAGVAASASPVGGGGASAPSNQRPGRIIVTAVGVNRPGILSEVTGAVGELGGDIADVSQLISGGYFHAILVVDAGGSNQSFTAFRDALIALSEPSDYVVTVIDERVFQAMHRL